MATNTVILLAGPSSTGKSTLAKELQRRLPQPYLHIGIDTVIGMTPEHLNDWEGGEAPEGFSWRPSLDPEGQPVQLISLGAFAQRIRGLFLDLVRVTVGQGFRVIIDDVPVEREEFNQWKPILKDVKALFVGMSAPIEVLEEREITRGDRMRGSARGQFYQCRMDWEYDLVIDTHNLSLAEQADLILSKIREPEDST